MNKTCQILVFAQRDHAEAMRVSAGLTIFGHGVDLIFVDRIVEESEENLAQAELLELTEIEPLSLIDDPSLDRIQYSQLNEYLKKADHVINL
ncbi:MAG: hypothetical protein V7749_17145 [Cocleimonas sp.]